MKRRPFAVGCCGVLIALAGRVWAAPPAVTVAFDLSSLDEASFRRLDAVNLERRVVVRLVQEGFAVVSPAAGPHIVVRMLAVDDRIRLEALTLGAEEHREIVFEGADPHGFQLELAQKIVELARTIAPRVALPSAATSAATQTGTTSVHEVPSTPVVLEPPSFGVEAGAGFVLRSSVGSVRADPALRAGLRWGWSTMLALDVAIWPSFESNVSVFELVLEGGVAQRLDLSPSIAVEGALLAGVKLHFFSVDVPGAVEGDGTRADAIVTAALRGMWSFGVVEVGLGTNLSLASRDREHIEGHAVLWRRGILNVEALALLRAKGF